MTSAEEMTELRRMILSMGASVEQRVGRVFDAAVRRDADLAPSGGAESRRAAPHGSLQRDSPVGGAGRARPGGRPPRF